MKHFTVILFFLALGGMLLAADDGQEFKPSTQVLLIVSEGPMGPVAGLGVDASFLSHVVGSFALGLPFPDEGNSSLIAELAIKYFFRYNNTGFYALLGPVLILVPGYYGDPQTVSFFMAGVGVKAKFLKFLIFDFSLSAPATALFVYSEDLVYAGVAMLSLGVNL